MIYLFFLLYSHSSSACPSFVGIYVCDVSSTVKETRVVHQTLSGSITTYQIGELEIVADDRPRSVPDNENLKSAAFRGWCDGDRALKTQLVGKYFNSGYFGELTSDSEWILSSQGRLVRSTRGQIRQADGTLYPFEDEMNCVKSSSLPRI